MTCDAAQLLIEEELDGTLSPGPAEALRAHLRECPACARLREDLRRIEAALAGPEEHRVPDVTWDAMVGAAVSRAAPRPLVTGARLAVAFAAAAALVLVCWFTWAHTRRSAPSPNQSASAGPSPEPARRPEAPPAVAVAPRAVITPRAPSSRPGHPAHAGRARRSHAHEPQPAVAPPVRSQTPPADALAPEDVYLIYETALAFARDGRPTAGPLDLVSVARVRADSGDLPGAIEAYEAAVEASVRSPSLYPVATKPSPSPDPVVVQVPDPPAAVLLAWLPGGE
ncbi:MAG: hypothetical protein FJX75_17330 [Armatimonadetes bacterium]|nr:hypothetical protein [Armatimonadota bacterium]